MKCKHSSASDEELLTLLVTTSHAQEIGQKQLETADKMRC